MTRRRPTAAATPAKGLRAELIAKYEEQAARGDGLTPPGYLSPPARTAQRLRNGEPVEFSGWQIPQPWRGDQLAAYDRVVVNPDGSLSPGSPLNR